MNVTITGAVTHRCPFKDERDYGTVVISYEYDGRVLELGALRAALDGYADRAITHEAMTEELTAAFAPFGAHITTAWVTAGLEVEVG